METHATFSSQLAIDRTLTTGHDEVHPTTGPCELLFLRHKIAMIENTKSSVLLRQQTVSKKVDRRRRSADWSRDLPRADLLANHREIDIAGLRCRGNRCQ